MKRMFPAIFADNILVGYLIYFVFLTCTLLRYKRYKKTPTYVRTVRTARKTETFSLCLLNKSVYEQQTYIEKTLA